MTEGTLAPWVGSRGHSNGDAERWAVPLGRTVEEQTEQPRTRPRLSLLRRVWIGLAGSVVLIAGIVMILYPGPGWLVVFFGLAILAKEFTWADRVLQFAKRYYDAWLMWLARQNLAVRLAVLALTGLVVVVTLWLLNVFGMVGGWFGIEWPWVSSPIV
jgi:uncharacterized protein (TIGR02611 family)